MSVGGVQGLNPASRTGLWSRLGFSRQIEKVAFSKDRTIADTVSNIESELSTQGRKQATVEKAISANLKNAVKAYEKSLTAEDARGIDAKVGSHEDTQNKPHIRQLAQIFLRDLLNKLYGNTTVQGRPISEAVLNELFGTHSTSLSFDLNTDSSVKETLFDRKIGFKGDLVLGIDKVSFSPSVSGNSGTVFDLLGRFSYENKSLINVSAQSVPLTASGNQVSQQVSPPNSRPSTPENLDGKFSLQVEHKDGDLEDELSQPTETGSISGSKPIHQVMTYSSTFTSKLEQKPHSPDGSDDEGAKSQVITTRNRTADSKSQGKLPVDKSKQSFKLGPSFAIAKENRVKFEKSMNRLTGAIKPLLENGKKAFKVAPLPSYIEAIVSELQFIVDHSQTLQKPENQDAVKEALLPHLSHQQRLELTLEFVLSRAVLCEAAESYLDVNTLSGFSKKDFDNMTYNGIGKETLLESLNRLTFVELRKPGLSKQASESIITKHNLISAQIEHIFSKFGYDSYGISHSQDFGRVVSTTQRQSETYVQPSSIPVSRPQNLCKFRKTVGDETPPVLPRETQGTPFSSSLRITSTKPYSGPKEDSLEKQINRRYKQEMLFIDNAVNSKDTNYRKVWLELASNFGYPQQEITRTDNKIMTEARHDFNNIQYRNYIKAAIKKNITERFTTQNSRNSSVDLDHKLEQDDLPNRATFEGVSGNSFNAQPVSQFDSSEPNQEIGSNIVPVVVMGTGDSITMGHPEAQQDPDQMYRDEVVNDYVEAHVSLVVQGTFSMETLESQIDSLTLLEQQAILGRIKDAQQQISLSREFDDYQSSNVGIGQPQEDQPSVERTSSQSTPIHFRDDGEGTEPEPDENPDEQHQGPSSVGSGHSQEQLSFIPSEIPVDEPSQTGSTTSKGSDQLSVHDLDTVEGTGPHPE